MSEDSLTSGRRRRTYTQQFKAEMVAQCLQGDVSLASLAVEHGMNPNVLHRWVKEHERYGHHTLGDEDTGRPQHTTTLSGPMRTSGAPFIPLPLSPHQSLAPAGSETIRLELKRGAATVHISWPVSAAAQCAELLREWLR